MQQQCMQIRDTQLGQVGDKGLAERLDFSQLTHSH
jgi:hypothetical protein